MQEVGTFTHRGYEIVCGQSGGRYDAEGRLVEQGYGCSYKSPDGKKSTLSYGSLENAKHAIDLEIGPAAKK